MKRLIWVAAGLVLLGGLGGLWPLVLVAVGLIVWAATQHVPIPWLLPLTIGVLLLPIGVARLDERDCLQTMQVNDEPQQCVESADVSSPLTLVESVAMLAIAGGGFWYERRRTSTVYDPTS